MKNFGLISIFSLAFPVVTFAANGIFFGAKNSSFEVFARNEVNSLIDIPKADFEGLNFTEKFCIKERNFRLGYERLLHPSFDGAKYDGLRKEAEEIHNLNQAMLIKHDIQIRSCDALIEKILER